MIEEKLNFILVPVSALFFAYVHHTLRFDTYAPWNSWLEFLGTWLVHFVALGLVSGVSYGFISSLESKLGKKPVDQMSPEDALNYFSIFVLVASVSLFILYPSVKG